MKKALLAGLIVLAVLSVAEVLTGGVAVIVRNAIACPAG